MEYCIPGNNVNDSKMEKNYEVCLPDWGNPSGQKRVLEIFPDSDDALKYAQDILGADSLGRIPTVLPPPDKATEFQEKLEELPRMYLNRTPQGNILWVSTDGSIRLYSDNGRELNPAEIVEHGIPQEITDQHPGGLEIYGDEVVHVGDVVATMFDILKNSPEFS